jgi:tRNA pseudouridine38-40 synthase
MCDVNPSSSDYEPGVRLRLDIAYAGSGFHGWQIQPAAPTVQGDLRRLLSGLLGRDAIPVAAGRTDAGVHARGQVAHLSVRNEDEAERVIRALPRMCDRAVQIIGVRRVSPDFNARFSAVGRRYSYHLTQTRDIFHAHQWYVYRRLDRAAMQAAAVQLRGTHDFTSFCKTTSLKDDGNLCHVTVCNFEWTGEAAIFSVKANRFLHHMVRNMVGTLVEIGRGERPPDDVPRILAARRRSAAGRMAPAGGLFLEEVEYPPHLLDPAWRDPGNVEPTAKE